MEIEGKTLGEKHHNFNKLLVQHPYKRPLPISHNDGDLQNLLKISTACRNRDVDFILETFKSNDMLLVSKAITHSTWLITDEQYTYIINPEYLYITLAPHMMTKAFNKLLLHTRLNLKHEHRAEAFYIYEKEKNPHNAYKWLYNCSTPFIEKAIKDCNNIPFKIVRRLCRKSVTIFDAFAQKENIDLHAFVTSTLFMIKREPQKFIDVINKLGPYCYPQLGQKAVNKMMVNSPKWIIENIQYLNYKMHIPNFARRLGKMNEIQSFLLKHIKNYDLRNFYEFHNLKYFLSHIPRVQRYQFVKKNLIDRELEKDNSSKCALRGHNITNTIIHRLYRYAPFEVAFQEMKKLIQIKSSPEDRSLIIADLLYSAGNNLQYIEAVLQYYHDKHINEQLQYKIIFMIQLLTQTTPYDYTDKMWNILNELFYSMEIYTESGISEPICIQTIIIYHVLRGEKVPETIEKKFQFNTLKNLQHKLKDEEKEKVFNYALSFLSTKIEALKLISENDFYVAVALMENILLLLKDWKKQLLDYPFVINKIKDLINIRQEKSWKLDLRSIYYANKSWRRDMFEFSIDMNPTEQACINALKHDPILLSRCKEQVDAICINDTISLQRFLTKLRVYWPQSLASELSTVYLEKLQNQVGHKALIMGLCKLLPQSQLLELVEKYKPEESKINWSKIDTVVLNIRKQIARNIQIARPMVPLDAVLCYAKGDYLQFAVPSLNGILYNMSKVQSQQSLTQLLNAPPSLQKFGIRLFFVKFNFESLKPVIVENWKCTNNSSIRALLFTSIHTMLCKEKNPSVAHEIWDLMRNVISELTPDENVMIYKKLSQFKQVPVNVRGNYFETSFLFLKSLPAKANCEQFLTNLIFESREIIELLSDDFVVNVLLKNINEIETGHSDNYNNISILASYLLCSSNEEIQMERCERVLKPLLDVTLPNWNEIRNECFYIRNFIKDLLFNLGYCFTKFAKNKKVIPLKMFKEIQVKLEGNLLLAENYTILTVWKLLIAFIQVIQDENVLFADVTEDALPNSETEFSINDEMKEKLNSKIVPQFIKTCLAYLKEDVNRMSPLICEHFAHAFGDLLTRYLEPFAGRQNSLVYLKSVLDCENSMATHLLVYKYLSIYGHGDQMEQDTLKEISKILLLNVEPPSEVLTILYFSRFGDDESLNMKYN